jgi:hypothetical protein
LITGDFTHEGDERAYQLLLEQLNRLACTFFLAARQSRSHVAPMSSTANHERLHTKQIILQHWQVLAYWTAT